MDNVDLKPANLLNDISPCDFAQVSWVIPIGQNSDQPGNPNTVGGPSWVASIVNAIEGVFWISGRARLDLRTNVPLESWEAPTLGGAGASLRDNRATGWRHCEPRPVRGDGAQGRVAQPHRRPPL